MKSATRIALAYTFVSSFATAANIGTQAVSTYTYSGVYSLELSVLAGTVMAFPVKYILEKKYVFDFKADNLRHDTRLFIIYGLMGVFTTAIFWAVEFAFHHVFGTNAMRYLGGAIGLTMGSYIKYRLDKRFVFNQELV
jgi:putative flippase GtrA